MVYLTLEYLALVKRGYDTNHNYLGVRSQESGGKQEEETLSIRRKFFSRVSGTKFYRALICTDIIPQITNAEYLNQ
ncbi:hypothetical protein [Okeania sp. SIO2B3]|uniref:hypothetical protein n=1 Tax=Okeania sp. SIO2B3 TaxID=2607784 RepID=UPI0013C268AA|nr:hypothetical protein [Okeania sp. SIO2B3]NET46392.1 hypothetical protein [Okeania sp. SIO2B3]